MTMLFESGKVTFFDRHKEYGFLTDAAGTQVYFRYKAGRIVIDSALSDKPALSRNYRITRGAAVKSVDRPKIGENLYFVREDGPRGTHVSLWCFAERYRHMEEKIRQRKVAKMEDKK